MGCWHQIPSNHPPAPPPQPILRSWIATPPPDPRTFPAWGSRRHPLPGEESAGPASWMSADARTFATLFGSLCGSALEVDVAVAGSSLGAWTWEVMNWGASGRSGWFLAG